MHPADIRAAITKAGSTQAAIAQQLGVTAGAVWNVINGKGWSDRIAAHIASLVREPVHVLWPAVPPLDVPVDLPVCAKPHLRLSVSGAITQVSVRRTTAQPRA